MPDVVRDAFGSKKFLVFLASVILAIGNKLASHFGVQLDPDTVTQLVAIAGAYIVGQGIADHGKEAAIVNAAAGTTTTTHSIDSSGSTTGMRTTTVTPTPLTTPPAASPKGSVAWPVMALLAIAGVALLVLGGCGAKTHAAEQALIDCETAAVKAKLPDLLPTVTAILATGGKDWKQQLDALVQYAGEESLACTVKAAGELFAKPKVGGPLNGEGANREALARADDALILHHWAFRAASSK